MAGMQIVALCSGVFFFGWLLAAFKTKRTKVRESAGSRFRYTVIIAVGFYLLFANLRETNPLTRQWLPATSFFETAGITIVVTGFLIAVWARLHIGRNWSADVTVKENHQLIRTGPYRWVRHPIYTGLIVSTAGAAIVNGQIRGIVSVFLVYLGFYIKSRKEEEFMQKTFGEEYDGYRKSTGRIIPRI